MKLKYPKPMPAQEGDLKTLFSSILNKQLCDITVQFDNLKEKITYLQVNIKLESMNHTFDCLTNNHNVEHFLMKSMPQ